MTWAEYTSLLEQIEGKLQRLRQLKAQYENTVGVPATAASAAQAVGIGGDGEAPAVQPFERGVGTAMIDAPVETAGIEIVPYRRDESKPPDRITAKGMAAEEAERERLIREQVDRIVGLGTDMVKPSETTLPLPGGGSAELRPVTDEERMALADVSDTEAFLLSAINEALLGLPESMGTPAEKAMFQRMEEQHPEVTTGGKFLGAAAPIALSGGISRAALKPVIAKMAELGLNPKTVAGATAAAAGKLGMSIGTEAGTGAVYGTLRSLGSGDPVPGEVASRAVEEAALFAAFGGVAGTIPAVRKYLGDLREVINRPGFGEGLKRSLGEGRQLEEARRMLKAIDQTESVGGSEVRELASADQVQALADRFPTGKRAKELGGKAVNKVSAPVDVTGGAIDEQSLRGLDRRADVEGLHPAGSDQPARGQIPGRKVSLSAGDEARGFGQRQAGASESEVAGPSVDAGATGDVEQGTLELHSGVNPFALMRNMLKRAFGAPAGGEGRRLVNVVGTPEVVLKERGIVEPFIEAGEKMKARRNEIRESLAGAFKGIRKGSKADQELFGKLDDPAIELTGEELKLREHFDGLLDEVNAARAVRGEKPIMRRKGYITHLLDYAEEQSKLFDDGPQTLKFPFEVREGGMHRMSAIEATQVYTEAALREIYLAEAVRQAVPKVEALAPRLGPIMTQRPVIGRDGKQYMETLYHFRERNPGTERNYAEQFIMRQLGWPSRMERSIEEVLGVSPRTQRRAAQAVTAGFYRMLIGAALDTGVKNLTQGINTLSEFGLAPTLKGYGMLLTSGGRKVAREARLLEDYEPLLYGGELKLGQGALKKFDDYVLSGPMRFAEFVNRGASYHAAMDVALKGGMAVEDAHVFALESVRKLQFAYGKTHISPHVQSALVRPLFQFTSFPIKQAELMYRWTTAEGPEGQRKLLRYLATTGALVMGGKYGDPDLSGVFFDPFVMVDPDSDQEQKLPFSDDRVKFSWEKLISSGFVSQGPAPVISVPLDVIELAVESDPAKRKLKFDELKRIIPNRYAAKLYEIFQDAKRGHRVTGRDRRLVDVEPRDLILRALGFRSNEWERVKSKRERVVEVEDYYYAQRKKFIDLALDGERDQAREVFQELAERYPYLTARFLKSITLEALVDEARKKRMTADERFYDENSLRETIGRELED